MPANFTAKSLSFDIAGTGAADNGSARRNNARSRLAKILSTSTAEVIELNLRPKPKAEQWAANVTFIEAALCISRLDQILSRPRRGPRAARSRSQSAPLVASDPSDSLSQESVFQAASGAGHPNR